LWLASSVPFCLDILGFLGSQRLSAKRNLGIIQKWIKQQEKGDYKIQGREMKNFAICGIERVLSACA
jgi:hypothetical protein